MIENTLKSIKILFNYIADLTNTLLNFNSVAKLFQAYFQLKTRSTNSSDNFVFRYKMFGSNDIVVSQIQRHTILNSQEKN